MSFVSDVLAELLEDAQTAGAAVTPAYTDIEIGAPMPRSRCIRVWWTGEFIPAPQMNDQRYSLSTEFVGHGFAVAVFEPMSDLSEISAENRMGAMGAFVDALRGAIDADRTLGGKSVSVEPEETPVDYANLGGTLYAFAAMPIAAGIVEHTIGGSS